MSRTNQQIAEAFSKHNFAATYEYFADDISWDLVGAGTTKGREKIIATCDESAKYLADQRVEFSKFRSITADNFVIVESTAEYIDADEASSHVSSCDIYEFADSKLVAITSYNIELDQA